jgi:hypothetical protein
MWLEMVWGLETKKEEEGVYPQLGTALWRVGGPGLPWRRNKLFLLAVKP